MPSPPTDRVAILVEPSAPEIEAGAEFSLAARVILPAGWRLAVPTLTVRDGNGAQLASAELRPEGSGEFKAGEIRLQAPMVVGDPLCQALVRVLADDGAEQVVAVPVEIAVVPHTAIITAWGLPSAIPAGERFGFQVGIKCSCGCNLAGRTFRVLDPSGVEMAAGALDDRIWPGTEGLFFADVEAEAPDTAADHVWTVECAASEEGPPHGADSFAFSVKVVPAADFEVTVEAFDIDKQRPVTGAHVLLHPYRAITDEEGIARLRVARGSYRLVVSGFKYIPFEETVEAVADVSARAELKAEPPVQYW